MNPATGSVGTQAFAFFETAIGRCAIAWSARGVVGTTLPGTSDRAVVARVHRTLPGASASQPPSGVEAAIVGIRALLGGVAHDLRGVVLDTSRVPAHERAIYAAAREIAPGEVRTYGELAAAVADQVDAQEVGRALARNPFPIVVPCHRVVAANGSLGGFSGPGGVQTKQRLLAIEGVRYPAAQTLFDVA